ncbi:MAG TPA: macro domain-containing protein [Acidimicrobiia bacterium]|nr:macro domain-containing protein [Acidimicrobiia bacterium]
MRVTPRLEAVLGDLTLERTDVIVNAANPELLRGGGVCGAIFARAGAGLAEACAALGGCPTGDAVATPGFGLAARWIVHAVGPVWHGGGRGEVELLRSAYERSLAVADGLEARSIAFPAISTGIYGAPLREATAVAVATCRLAEPRHLELVRFVCFDEATLAVYEAALAA